MFGWFLFVGGGILNLDFWDLLDYHDFFCVWRGIRLAIVDLLVFEP